MAAWQLTLEGLTGLTRNEKDNAEGIVLQKLSKNEERDYFLRGSDEEASTRIKALLSPVGEDECK